MSKVDIEAFANIGDFFSPDVDLDDYNVKTEGTKFLDQPENKESKYDNIQKIANGSGDDYVRLP